MAASALSQGGKVTVNVVTLKQDGSVVSNISVQVEAEASVASLWSLVDGHAGHGLVFDGVPVQRKDILVSQLGCKDNTTHHAFIVPMFGHGSAAAPTLLPVKWDFLNAKVRHHHAKSVSNCSPT